MAVPEAGSRAVRLPPAYVISMAGAEARRAWIASHFGERGVAFEFFDAIDGRGLHAQGQPLYDGKRRFAYYGKHLGGAEWGCILSHLGVLENLLAHDQDSALVFEDDVHLDPAFTGVVERILDLGFPFDVVRFMGDPKIERKGYRRIARVGDNIWLGRLPSAHGGAHAYLISKSGARTIVEHIHAHGIAAPFDMLLGQTWRTGIESYSVNGLAWQDPVFGSDIGPARFARVRHGIDAAGLAFALRRAWLRLGEMAGKRWMYARSFWHDRALGRKLAAMERGARSSIG